MRQRAHSFNSASLECLLDCAVFYVSHITYTDRLYGRRFLQVKRPYQQYESTEGDATKEKTKNENN